MPGFVSFKNPRRGETPDFMFAAELYRKIKRTAVSHTLLRFVKIGSGQARTQCACAVPDFYESEQCVRMNFTPFAYLTIRSAARPNFSSPLRSPMKNFQRSQTRAHVPGLFRYLIEVVSWKSGTAP